MADGTENIRKITDLGPLHQLLLKASPTAASVGISDDDPGRRSITTLAVLMEISAWSIYCWIKRNHIPPARAKTLVERCEGRVTLEELHPFVYG